MHAYLGSAMTGGAARRRALERPSTMETAVSCRNRRRPTDSKCTNSLLIVNPAGLGSAKFAGVAMRIVLADPSRAVHRAMTQLYRRGWS